MHKIKNHIHNLVIFLSHAIYLHTSNQIASLLSQAKSTRSTKHERSHALSLSHVSQALRYEPGSTSTRTKQAICVRSILMNITAARVEMNGGTFFFFLRIKTI